MEHYMSQRFWDFPNYSLNVGHLSHFLFFVTVVDSAVNTLLNCFFKIQSWG